jgi:hypothetical protein
VETSGGRLAEALSPPSTDNAVEGGIDFLSHGFYGPRWQLKMRGGKRNHPMDRCGLYSQLMLILEKRRRLDARESSTSIIEWRMNNEQIVNVLEFNCIDLYEKQPITTVWNSKALMVLSSK